MPAGAIGDVPPLSSFGFIATGNHDDGQNVLCIATGAPERMGRRTRIVTSVTAEEDESIHSSSSRESGRGSVAYLVCIARGVASLKTLLGAAATVNC